MTGGREPLAVGYVRRPHGVHGEVVVEVATDFPERVSAGVEVGVGGPRGPERWLEVAQARFHKGAWLLALDGVESRDDADALRDLWLFLPEQEREELPESYYYEHELEGLRAVDVGGRELGRVTRLDVGGAGALLVLSTARGEQLVPFRSPIVARVDLEAGAVVLDPPRGLLDDDAL